MKALPKLLCMRLVERDAVMKRQAQDGKRWQDRGWRERIRINRELQQEQEQKNGRG